MFPQHVTYAVSRMHCCSGDSLQPAMLAIAHCQQLPVIAPVITAGSDHTTSLIANRNFVKRARRTTQRAVHPRVSANIAKEMASEIDAKSEVPLEELVDLAVVWASQHGLVNLTATKHLSHCQLTRQRD